MVFILSVPLLRERVTAVKMLSVVLTIVRVCLVSFFGSHGGGGGSRTSNSTEGMVSSFISEDEQLDSSEGTVKSTPFGYVVSSL